VKQKSKSKKSTQPVGVRQRKYASRKQSDLLSLAIEQSSEGIAIVDLDGNLEYLNSAFAELHGYTPIELLGKNLSIFHTPEQMPSVKAANRQLKNTGVFKGEVWHARRNGTTFQVMMHNSLVLNADGNPIAMIGTMRDISDSKQSAKILYEYDQKYNILAECSQTGIYIHQNNKIVYANQSFADLHGYRINELIGMNYFDLFHPEDREEALKVRAKRLSGQILPEKREVRRIKKDGKILWCEVVAVSIEYQGKDAIMGNMVNISERKRKENFLAALNEISLTINQSLKLEYVLKAALIKIMELFTPYAAHIRLFDKKKQALVLAAHNGLTTGDLRKLKRQLKLDESIVISMALKSSKAVVLENAIDNYATNDYFFNRIGCPSIVCMILNAKGNIQGSMSIHAREPRKFTEDDVELFTSIGNQIGIAIENARLYQGMQKTIGELETARDRLNKSAEELEMRVQKRTSDLLKLNKQLKKEIRIRRKIEKDLLTYIQNVYTICL